MMRSVTIAGGGLAGLALGIALRRHDVPVVAHEAGMYPRHRVCGEFISGVTDETLERLGIDQVLASAESLQSVSWYLGSHRILASHLPVPAKGISRYHLDAALGQAFTGCGGHLVTRSRLRPEPAPGLVWSAGRLPARGRWIGLKCHVSGLPLESDLEMHLGRNGYVGLARVEGGKVNVCGLFRLESRLGGRGSVLLRNYLCAGGLSALAERFGSAVADPNSSAATAGFRLGWQKPPAMLAVVGDACGMIPPFTGNGMSMAFQSAESALEPLLAYAQGRHSWHDTVPLIRRQQKNRFRRRLRWAGMLHPFLTTRAGQVLLACALRSGVVSFSQCLQLVR